MILAAVLSLAVHGVAKAQHPLFGGAPYVATGYSPISLVAADLNDDGLLDLVASNHGEDTVSVALGAGDGSFSSSRRFPAPAGWDIATADLDRDGTADLAVTSDYGYVAVIRGAGDGTFGPPAYYQVSPISRGVDIGDFNGDAVPDVAVGSAIGPGVVSILLGKGDGTLWPRIDYPAGSGCNGVLAADLNADRALDLVVGNDFIDAVSILLGNGDGTFQEPLFEPVMHPPWGISCADFDGDGVADLALACEQVSGQVAVLSGRGDGTFDAAVYYPVGNAPFDLAAADFDQDGAVDLVVSNRRDGDMSVLLGNGDGTFAAAYDYGAGREPRGLVCEDLDGDGRTDVAIADLVFNRIVVKLNVHPAPPTADAGPDRVIHWAEQGAATVLGQASDPDPNTILTYRWLDITGPLAIVLLDWSYAGPAGEADLDLSLLPPFSIGTSELQLEVSDGEESATDSMLLTVTNSAPAADAGENLMVSSAEQAEVVIIGNASDLDGDAVLYRWADVTGGGYAPLTDWAPAGPAGEAPLAVADFGPLPAGAYTLRLELTDGLESAHSDMVLTIENSPPDVSMTGGGTYHCGDPILVSGDISDFDGDLIEWEILRDSTVLALGQIVTPTGGAAVALPWVDLTMDLGIGTHELVLTGFDGTNLSEPASCVISVIDVDAPTVAPIPSVSQLWPPNHKLVPVTIEANAYDDSGGPVYLDVSVMSSEPPDGQGDGSTEPDWIVDGVEEGPGGMIYLQLRSERSGKGEGRTYTVTIVATDAYGNSSSAQVNIIAPHDKGKR